MKRWNFKSAWRWLTHPKFDETQSIDSRNGDGGGGGHSGSHVKLFATPMDCRIPGFPVFHYLMEFAQIYVHWVDDAIQPSVTPLFSCPQSFPASGSFPGFCIKVAKVLEL